MGDRDACAVPVTGGKLYAGTKLAFLLVTILLLFQVLVHENIHNLSEVKKNPSDKFPL